MTTKRWTMKIEGRVQGVYYRAGTEKAASDLGLVGYTCNLADGGVEIVAEGDRQSLQALQDWCWQGPPAARVDQVTVAESDPTGEFSDFTIRR